MQRPEASSPRPGLNGLLPSSSPAELVWLWRVPAHRVERDIGVCRLVAARRPPTYQTSSGMLTSTRTAVPIATVTALIMARDVVSRHRSVPQAADRIVLSLKPPSGTRSLYLVPAELTGELPEDLRATAARPRLSTGQRYPQILAGPTAALVVLVSTRQVEPRTGMTRHGKHRPQT